MMFRTIIIPAAHVQLARDLAAAIDPVASVGLFQVALTDSSEPTHYISTGYVSANFAAVLPLTTWEHTDAGWEEAAHSPGLASEIVAMAAALDPPFSVTVEQITAAFEASDVSDQEPFVAMARLGLAMVQEGWGNAAHG